MYPYYKMSRTLSADDIAGIKLSTDPRRGATRPRNSRSDAVANAVAPGDRGGEPRHNFSHDRDLRTSRRNRFGRKGNAGHHLANNRGPRGAGGLRRANWTIASVALASGSSDHHHRLPTARTRPR